MRNTNPYSNDISNIDNYLKNRGCDADDLDFMSDDDKYTYARESGFPYYRDRYGY
jgi:hypothetical protein